MEYRLLGRTGVSVSPLCLGTMMFGPWGNDDRADAIRVIHRALDAGINFVDTADVYSGGVSEEIVGEALQGRRDDVVLATKFFMPMDDRPNHSGGSRKWIMQEVENSLRRLKTDYIDLYQVHRPSPTTDVEETLGALTDLVRQGKVRYIGSSSYSGQPDRRGAMGVPRAEPRTVRHRAAPVLDPGPRHRGGRPPDRAALRHGNPRVQPAVRWLAHRPVAQGRRRYAHISCPAERPVRHDHAGEPAQTRRRRRARAARRAVRNDADRTRARLGRSTTRASPPRSSARAPWSNSNRSFHRRDVTLTTEILDRIDELVAPGVTINPDDNSYGAAELTPEARRR